MRLRRQTLTVLGPSFIKAGQVLASRPDILREDYMEELCVLQDDVPSFPDQLASAPVACSARTHPRMCCQELSPHAGSPSTLLEMFMHS